MSRPRPAARPVTGRRRAAAAGLATAAALGGMTALPSVAGATDGATAPTGVQADGSRAGTTTAAAERRRAAASRANRAGRPRALVSPTRVRPVVDYRLSARYGQRGSLWSSGRHTGLDFSAPHGRPVRAAQTGRVAFAGWDGPYGKSVIIRHGNGVWTRYAHLSRLTVRRGEAVIVGDRVGRIGSTGNSTGPHLHFEVLRDGRHRDPHRWLQAR